MSMRYANGILALLILLACGIPKDPEHSWHEARRDGLRVGVTINAPYTAKYGDSLGGSEVELIRRFAESENLKIDWVESSESELVEMLNDYELHVVIGGFDKKTSWKKEAGTTRPYDKEHVMLIARGENELLRHLEIFLHQKSG